MSEEDAVKFCTNCKRDIHHANYVMHSMHCQRNLALCTKCDEPIPLVELKSHNVKFHASVECPACHMHIERSKLSEHEKTTCKRRAICCNYCHIETDATELQEHENYCGSRTEKCEECGEYVMLKYTQLHLDSNHGFLKLDEEPGPTPSWNKPRSSAGLQNDLSRIRKVPNISQNPLRPTPLTNADLFARPIGLASQISNPDASARLPRWIDGDHLVSSQSRPYVARPNSYLISQDPIRVLPTRNTPEAIPETLSRISPDLIRGYRNTPDPIRVGSMRNPVQESVRPSAAGNRLSPSKRTNDMPQVNSAAAVDIPKALHKPVIRQSDSDRLMAGLGKTEMERNTYAMTNNMLEQLDLDHDMGGDIVALPCEFCDAMIPANQLVIHETGCRPDLACFKNQMHPDVLGDNGLPCEFCGGLYPPHNLLSHQAHCEVPTRGDMLINEFDLPAVKEVNVTKQKQLNLSEEERQWPQQQQPVRLLPNSTIPPLRGSDEFWQKPIANVNPIGGLRPTTSPTILPSGALNGYQRRPMSTGAVPKQKAGIRPGLREVQQEVPRPSTAAPIAPRNFQTHHR